MHMMIKLFSLSMISLHSQLFLSVEDIILAGNSLTVFEVLKIALNRAFSIKDLGRLKFS